MARVTVEGCLKNVSSRFELVMVAAKRAHQLSSGTHKSMLDTGKDKSTVVALREIEEGLIDSSILNDTMTMRVGSADLSEIEQELNNTSIDEKSDKLTEITPE